MNAGLVYLAEQIDDAVTYLERAQCAAIGQRRNLVNWASPSMRAAAWCWPRRRTRKRRGLDPKQDLTLLNLGSNTGSTE